MEYPNEKQIDLGCLHELLHGVHLTCIMFNEVGKSGSYDDIRKSPKVSRYSLFSKHPELSKMFTKIEEDLANYYQLIGNYIGKVEDDE